MEEEAEVSRVEMKKIAAAMSEVAGRLAPGASLSYEEEFLLRGSRRGYRKFDARECRLVLRLAGRPERAVVRRAVVSPDEGPAGRKKLLRRLEADGWPSASSAEEMRLKLALAGDAALAGLCRRTAGREYREKLL